MSAVRFRPVPRPREALHGKPLPARLFLFCLMPAVSEKKDQGEVLPADIPLWIINITAVIDVKYISNPSTLVEIFLLVPKNEFDVIADLVLEFLPKLRLAFHFTSDDKRFINDFSEGCFVVHHKPILKTNVESVP